MSLAGSVGKGTADGMWRPPSRREHLIIRPLVFPRGQRKRKVRIPDTWPWAQQLATCSVNATAMDRSVSTRVAEGDTSIHRVGACAHLGCGRTPGIDRVKGPLDDIEDIEFWHHVNDEQLNGSPLYYRRFLERKAGRCTAVITTLARALRPVVCSSTGN